MTAVEVPMTVGSAFPLVSVPVEVNDEDPSAFIVDTGAARTVVGRNLANRLGLVPRRKENIATATGSLAVEIASLTSLTVAGLPGRVTDVTIADVSAIAAAGLAVDGVLGVDFLRDFSIGFDHARGVLLLDAAPSPDPEGRVPFTLAPNKPFILVPVTIGESGPHLFGVDTGAAISVVDAAIAERADLGSRDGALAVGASGSQQIQSATANIRLGKDELLGLEVGVLPLDHLSVAAGVDLAGLLGQDFLRRTAMTIDYPHSCLHQRH